MSWAMLTIIPRRWPRLDSVCSIAWVARSRLFNSRAYQAAWTDRSRRSLRQWVAGTGTISSIPLAAVQYRSDDSLA